MSIKRGFLLTLSLYSLAFVSFPAGVLLLTGEPIEFRSPWLQPISLLVFVAAWAKLWEDFGAATERYRQKEPSHDDQ